MNFYCQLCGRIPHRRGLCRECQSKLDSEIAAADKFKSLNPSFTQDDSIGVFDFVAFYEGVAKRVLEELKFHSNLNVAPLIAGYFRERILAHKIDNPLIVPSPASESGLIERGYDQCAEIAKLTGLKWARLITTSKSTRAREQKKLSKDEREEAAKSKYSFDEELFCAMMDEYKGFQVVVIDDVCTTGSTLSSISSIIEQKLHAKPALSLVWARELTKIA